MQRSEDNTKHVQARPRWQRITRGDGYGRSKRMSERKGSMTSQRDSMSPHRHQTRAGCDHTRRGGHTGNRKYNVNETGQTTSVGHGPPPQKRNKAYTTPVATTRAKGMERMAAKVVVRTLTECR